MTKKKLPSRVEIGARIYGCEVGDLLSHHEFDDGSVAIIAPSGQKFTYSADRILRETTKPDEPPPAPAAGPAEASGSADSRDEMGTKVAEVAAAAVEKKASRGSRDSKGSDSVEQA